MANEREPPAPSQEVRRVATPVLSVEGVVRDFGEAIVTRVLHGIDFAIDSGEFAALMGPSGSGKSTLLNIMGLLDRPTAGTVRIQGHDTANLDDAERTALRGRSMGFVFQFHHLLPAFTSLENVMMPSWARAGMATGAIREKAATLLQQVGLESKCHTRVSDLSGGQQQRVAIARALAHGPALLLADEPTGNLDTQTSNEVFDLMRQFNRKAGTTFLIVTHDPRIADRCHRIVEIVDGRIVRDARTG